MKQRDLIAFSEKNNEKLNRKVHVLHDEMETRFTYKKQKDAAKNPSPHHGHSVNGHLMFGEINGFDYSILNTSGGMNDEEF